MNEVLCFRVSYWNTKRDAWAIAVTRTRNTEKSIKELRKYFGDVKVLVEKRLGKGVPMPRPGVDPSLAVVEPKVHQPQEAT